MKLFDKKLQMSALFLKRKKCLNQGKRVKKAKAIKEKKKRLKWTDEQTQRYCKFIERNELILGKKFKKQKQRIYNKMANYVRTRNSRQCKSHHQKLLKKYENVITIVDTLENQIKLAKSQSIIQRKQKPVVNVSEDKSPKNNQTIHDYSQEIEMSHSNQCCQDCFLNSLISDGFLPSDEKCVHKQFLS